MVVNRLSLLLCCIVGTLGENFLILHPVYVGSHEFTMRNLGEMLVERGHTVTQVVFKREGVTYPRGPVEVIQLTADTKNGTLQFHNFNEFGEVSIDGELFWRMNRRFWNVPTSIIEMNGVMCETLFGDSSLFAMLQSRNYSALIVDLFTNSCGMLFSSLFKLPTIGFLQIGAVGLEGRFIGALNPPSVSSQLMSDVGVPANFMERAWAFLCASADWLLHNYIQAGGAEAVAQKYLDEVPNVYELFGKLDLILSGSHPIVEFPRYMPQKMFTMGCFHCRPAQRIQNKVLREFLDSSPHPVILASFGYTMANSGHGQRNFLRVLLKAFKNLPVRVVIAFDPEREEKELVPNNVLLQRWVPQQDVLGHPKTAIFLSHCGISSVLEGVYHGVKMMAVPISLDQGENALRLKDLGVLKYIFDHKTVKPSEVLEATKKTFEDQRLRRNAFKYSQMMRDSLFNIKNETIRKIENAVKYGGQHLNIPSYKLNVIQFYCIDVVLFYLIFLSFNFWLFVRLSRRYYRYWKNLTSESVKVKNE